MTDFLMQMFGATWIEWLAAALNVIGVILTIRRSLWSFAFGIPGVVLYAWIYYDVRLYSEALLYVYYFVMLSAGVHWWLRGREPGAGPMGRVMIEATPGFERLVLALATVLAAVALGYVMRTYTDADIPFVDAATTALALTAQYCQSRRRVETYPLWAVYNAASVVIMLFKELIPFAAVYGIFLALSFVGMRAWIGAWRRGRPLEA